MATTLIVPGLNGSGPEHWQSWWESLDSTAVRVHQHPWHIADLPRWSNRVGQALDRRRGSVWIVAHSFGCLASVCAAMEQTHRVAGALLVAPADPDRFGVADTLPQGELPFPTAVVASTNDPWVGFMKAAYWARRWGSQLINAGKVGHINVDSGHGPWPEGRVIFQQLQQGCADLPNRQGDDEAGVGAMDRPWASSAGV